MDNNITWHGETILHTVSEKLTKNNFTAIIAQDKSDCNNKIMELMDPKDSVGVGGSMTLRDLGIIETLKKRGQNIVQHAPGMPLEESLKIRRKALTADVYMASPNAVTLDGTLLFCDGVGNRAAGMIFGPKKVIAIAGINKIVTDENAAWARLDTLAAPTNAKRLNLKTPCASTGRCTECDSPERICNIGVILWKKPRWTDYVVVLVPESLGY